MSLLCISSVLSGCQGKSNDNRSGSAVSSQGSDSNQDNGDQVVEPIEGIVTFQDIAPLLTKYKCVQCHGSQATVPLTTYEEVKNSDIVNQILTDKMPMGDAKVSAADKELIKKWLADGLLEFPPESDGHNRVVLDELALTHAPKGIRLLQPTELMSVLTTQIRNTFSLVLQLRGQDYQFIDHNHIFNNSSLTYDRTYSVVVENSFNAAVSDYYVTPCMRAADQATCFKDETAIIFTNISGAVPTAAERSMLDGTYDFFLNITGSTDTAFKKALEHVVLKLPSLLYRTEGLENEDGSLSAAEKARLLAFGIAGQTPDADLIASALNGTLNDPVVYASHVDRYLDKEEAAIAFGDFFRTLVNAYPSSSSENNLEVSFKLLAAHQFSKMDGFQQLFTTDEIMLHSTIERYYGLDGIGTSDYELVVDPSGVRAGLLTHPLFLSKHAHVRETSPIARAKTVLDHIACIKLPPPPDLVPSLAEVKEYNTVREKYERHFSKEFCAKCHKVLNPIGFAFENFDFRGYYVDTQNLDSNRAPENINPSGTITIDGQEQYFSDVKGFMDILSKSSQVKKCFARKLIQNAIGKDNYTFPELEAQIVSSLNTSGGSIKQAMKTLYTSQYFLNRR